MRVTGFSALTIAATSLLSPQVGEGARCNPGVFVSPVSHNVEVLLDHLITGDLNGDTARDIVAVSGSTGMVSVSLGNGDGTFAPPLLTDGGFFSVYSIALGDFNNDSRLDLAIGGFDDVVVLPGIGDGTFGEQVSTEVPVGSYLLLAAGHMDEDGLLDLVAGSLSGSVLSVLKGSGDGTFLQNDTHSFGNAPRSPVLADFNSDDSLDVVVAISGSNSVTVLLGAGDSTLEPPKDFLAGFAPARVAVTDLNTDGRPDIATTVNNLFTGEGFVSVLLGKGDGGFRAAILHSVNPGPFFLESGDLDEDGDPDLVVTSSGSVVVMIGGGDGSLSTLLRYPVQAAEPFPQSETKALDVSDLDGDGAEDIVVGFPGNAVLLFGFGNGAFLGVVQQPAGPTPNRLVLRDFDEDGNSDIAFGGGLSIGTLRGVGDGTFRLINSYPIDGSVADLAAGDFDRDGHLDLLAATGFDNSIVLLRGNGDLTFDPQVPQAVGGLPFALAVADWNGDGVLDVAVGGAPFSGGGNLMMLFGVGDGTFAPGPTQTFEILPASAAVGDFNADGLLDLVFGRQSPGGAAVFLGRGDGSFGPPVAYAVGSGISSVTSVDVNEDSYPDLIVANSEQDYFSVLLGSGTGTFGPPINLALAGRPSSIAAGDVTGDGHHQDIAVGTNLGSFSVYVGFGDGSFESPDSYAVERSPLQILIEDVNGGGASDIVVSQEGAISVLLNARLAVLPPAASVFCLDSAGTLSTKASGYGRVSYQWRKGGAELSDGGAVSGATTATLTIDPVGAGDAGSYDVVVTDLCTSVTSAAAELTVEESPAAPVVTAPFAAAPGQGGLVASVPEVAGHSYEWAITGGTIEAGQGTRAISFTAGPAGTTVVLRVTDTSTTGCESAAGTALVQVDFLDVLPSHPFHDFVVRVARQGISSGCGAGNFCPAQAVTRAQMSVLVLKGEHGGDYVPPGATGTVFGDVSATDFAASFIEQMAAEGLTSGCGGGNFCPTALVTRGQAAVFLLRAKHGSGYTPPAPTGVFGDVPVSSPFASWIEQFAAEGISAGCGGGNFCPSNAVTRGQMSVFLVKTFDLP